MPYETQPSYPDHLLDYYEHHFLRRIGECALANPGQFAWHETHTLEPVFDLYDSAEEGMKATNVLIVQPCVSEQNRVQALASRAARWGGEAKDTATIEILELAQKHEAQCYDDQLERHEIIRALIKTGRPDLAHHKLVAYQDDMRGRYRKLLREVGEGYCNVAQSKHDLAPVEPIVKELAHGDPNIKTIKISGWLRKKERTTTDARRSAEVLHKPLVAMLKNKQRMIDNPGDYIYPVLPKAEESPYTDAYYTGGIEAALALHDKRNRASNDKSVFWKYRSVAADLARSGEVAVAHQVAEIGLHRLAQEKEGGIVLPFEHYGLIRDVVDAYARAGNLQQAHRLVSSMSHQDDGGLQQAGFREVMVKYVQGQVEMLRHPKVLDPDTIDMCSDYLRKYCPAELERTATLERIIKEFLAPHGQVEAIRSIVSQLPAKQLSHNSVARALGEAHATLGDYQACAELFEYWPIPEIAVDALTAIVAEKRRRQTVYQASHGEQVWYN